jgi:ATP-dependent Lhr-like helicase
LPEVVEELNRFVSRADDLPVMLNTLDPANLYGSGAALDIPLLEGGTARLSRTIGNHLILTKGRPVLIIESYGKRLTALASASELEVRAALKLLPSLAGPSRRVLKVESFNMAPTLASPAAPWLTQLGFVRDHPGMAFYAGF